MVCAITFDWGKNDAIMKFKSFGARKSVSWGVIELTDCCNLNCKWCFANSPGADPFHMEIKDVGVILDALQDAGVGQVTYSGGEPTLYPHLKKAVSMAGKRGMVVHMNTNGYVLTADMASELKRAGLSQVQINIDSVHAGKHDTLRGREGSFLRAVQALKNSRKAGLTCVSQTVLTRDNQSEVIDIFRMSRSLGVQRCRMWDMTPSKGCARENSELLPTYYMASVQRVVDFAEEAGATNVEVSDPLFTKNIRTSLPMSGGYCVFAAGVVTYITSRGDAVFCCTLRDVLYNIFDKIKAGESVAEHHKLAVKAYLSKFALHETCQTCGHADICKGGCYTRRDFSGGMDYWCREAMILDGRRQEPPPGGSIHRSLPQHSPLRTPA